MGASSDEGAEKTKEKPQAVDFLNRERLLYLYANLLGSYIKCLVNDGSMYSGYFFTCDCQSCSIVIRQALIEASSRDEPQLDPNTTIIVPADQIVIIHADSVRMKKERIKQLSQKYERQPFIVNISLQNRDGKALHLVEDPLLSTNRYREQVIRLNRTNLGRSEPEDKQECSRLFDNEEEINGAIEAIRLTVPMEEKDTSLVLIPSDVVSQPYRYYHLCESINQKREDSESCRNEKDDQLDAENGNQEETKKAVSACIRPHKPSAFRSNMLSSSCDISSSMDGKESKRNKNNPTISVSKRKTNKASNGTSSRRPYRNSAKNLSMSCGNGINSSTNSEVEVSSEYYQPPTPPVQTFVYPQMAPFPYQQPQIQYVPSTLFYSPSLSNETYSCNMVLPLPPYVPPMMNPVMPRNSMEYYSSILTPSQASIIYPNASYHVAPSPQYSTLGYSQQSPQSQHSMQNPSLSPHYREHPIKQRGSHK